MKDDIYYIAYYKKNKVISIVKTIISDNTYSESFSYVRSDPDHSNGDFLNIVDDEFEKLYEYFEFVRTLENSEADEDFYDICYTFNEDNGDIGAKILTKDETFLYMI
jgi:hypothetical protein